MKGTVMSIAMLDAWVANSVQCLIERKKHGGHRQKEYADPSKRMMDNATKQLTENVRKFVRHWGWVEVGVDEDGLNTEERREAMMGTSRTATGAQTLLSVRKTFITVDESWFWTYVADVLGFVKDCYVGQFLEDGHTKLLEVPTESYEDCEKK